MIKVGIIGATGYAGHELVRILLGHKEVEMAMVRFKKLYRSEICRCISEFVSNSWMQNVWMTTWMSLQMK